MHQQVLWWPFNDLPALQMNNSNQRLTKKWDEDCAKWDECG